MIPDGPLLPRPHAAQLLPTVNSKFPFLQFWELRLADRTQPLAQVAGEVRIELSAREHWIASSMGGRLKSILLHVGPKRHELRIGKSCPKRLDRNRDRCSFNARKVHQTTTDFTSYHVRQFARIVGEDRRRFAADFMSRFLNERQKENILR